MPRPRYYASPSSNGANAAYTGNYSPHSSSSNPYEGSSPYGLSGTSSTRTRQYEPTSSLHRMISTRNAYNAHPTHPVRSVSPPRSHSERPRLDPRAYDDHRSVSPLGSSRFEKPYNSSSSSAGLFMQRAGTVRQSRETREREHPMVRTSTGGAYGGGKYSATGNLRRSNAVRSGGAYRSFGPSGHDENDSQEYRAGLTRQPKSRANFSSGGHSLSSWERY